MKLICIQTTIFYLKYRRVPNIANTFPRGKIRFFKLFFAETGEYMVNYSKIRISKGN